LIEKGKRGIKGKNPGEKKRKNIRHIWLWSHVHIKKEGESPGGTKKRLQRFGR